VFEPNSTPLAGNSTNSSFPNDLQASHALTVINTTAPSITVSPTTGGSQSVVTVAGKNFDPQDSAVTIEFAQNAVAPFTEIGGDKVTVPVQPDGTFTTAIVVGPSEVSGLTGNEAAYVAAVQSVSISASAAFTLEPISASCTAPCTNGQEVLTQIQAGTLTATDQLAAGNPDATDVSLSPVTLSGAFANSTGNMNSVLVVDARGTEGGWSLTGQLQSDFSNSTPHGATVDNTIPADFLTWNPSVSLPLSGGGPTGVLSQVAAGPSATLNNLSGAAKTLCSAAPGGGGGSYLCNATLSLAVPPYDAIGTYSAIMNLVLLGT